MNQKILNIEKCYKNVIIIFLLCLSLLQAIVSAATDTVTINVNVSEAAAIEVTPDIANFYQVTPGVVSFPNSLEFTITNVGSVNFTQMYVSMDVWESGQEDTNPLGTGNPANYYAGGFVVLMNETMLAGGSSDWRFVGRQEWNLTDKPGDYTPGTSSRAWGYFGNNSKQYFWDLSNGTADETCNTTGTQIRIKNWALNGSAAAYDLTAETTTYAIDSQQEDWGIFNAETTGPLDGYCVATWVNCTRMLIYQWDQDSPFSQCSSAWYIYNDSENRFNPDDQFDFNLTVWVPKGIPAGDTSSSVLTVTAN